MKPKQYVSIIVIGAFLSGCATYRPIVDTRNIISMNQYEKDVTECQEYAKRIDPASSAIISAAAGAVVGGLLVALVGAALGARNTGGYVAAGAIVGGTQSGLYSADVAMARQRAIIATCLKYRGYDVLE